MFSRTPRTVFCLLATTALAGCGWFGGGGGDADSEVEPAADAPSAEPVEVVEPEEPFERLELNLHVGERFPLIKTVEQTLSQSDGDAFETDRTRLQMLLAINVEEVVEDGRKRLGVRYHRVRYSHDIGGEHVEYDSGSPPATVPAAARAYHGLVENGFSFWIGPDNRVIELVGFETFLERCLKHVPVEERNAVLAELTASQGVEGIANFVDDSIGLLPYDADKSGRESAVRVGHQWTRSRQIVRPVPLHSTTRFTLKSLDEDTAEIDLVGTITPATTFGPSDQPSGDVQVVVRDGHTFGTCTIRRDSGLPARSHIERFFNMTVRLADGTSFEQRKRIVTTIETFREQGRPLAVGDEGVVPTNGTTTLRPPSEPGIEPPVVPADFDDR